MQRNVRLTVVVEMVLAAMAAGIGLDFGLYNLFKPTPEARSPLV
jgi:hypothetical protein